MNRRQTKKQNKLKDLCTFYTAKVGVATDTWSKCRWAKAYTERKARQI